MSDLISRSELIKHFEAVQLQEDAIGLDFVAIIDEIKEQATAYAVGKVVVELDETKETSLELVKLPKFLKKDLQELVNMCFDEAIEIVKKGGVSDDVCEWKYNDSEYYFESSCKHLHIFMSDGPKENEYRFCPYCGKKIKVME